MTDIRLAKLHRICLPGSSLSFLGAAAVERYYRFAEKSPKEKVFVEELKGEILGAALLSYEPATLMHRFFRECLTDIPFLLALPVAHPVGVARVVKGFIFSEPTPAVVQMLPEIVQIFTAEKVRGQGIGKKLLERAESDLRANKVQQYMLKTENRSDNPAVGFYVARGFEKLKTAGPMVYFRKSVG